MNNRPAVISPNVWIVAVVFLAIVVAAVAVLRIDRAGRGGSGLSERFDYPIKQYEKIEPALIRYQQTQEIPTEMQQPRSVAVGPEDRIYVAGDLAIHVFDSTGALNAKIAPAGRPTCLAVGGPGHASPGQVYVGTGRNVETFDSEGKPAGTWEIPGEKVHLTSIAVARDDVFVADCAARIVLRYDTSGELIGRIGDRDEDRGILGFVIPSPFFDAAVAPDGLLWVVNPGARRLEAYTFDGNPELFWGEDGVAVEGFFGCCNPANFAILPDGSFVTAEKGLLRVKVYTAQGQFDCVVAGPEQLDSQTPRGASPRTASRFDHEFKAVDVAADGKGRILVLDLARGSIRVYQRKQPVLDESDADQP